MQKYTIYIWYLLDAFAEVVKVTNHAGFWDTKLACWVLLIGFASKLGAQPRNPRFSAYLNIEVHALFGYFSVITFIYTFRIIGVFVFVFVYWFCCIMSQFELVKRKLSN